MKTISHSAKLASSSANATQQVAKSAAVKSVGQRKLQSTIDNSPRQAMQKGLNLMRGAIQLKGPRTLSTTDSFAEEKHGKVYKTTTAKKAQVWVKIENPEDVGKVQAASDFITGFSSKIAGNPKWKINTPTIREATSAEAQILIANSIGNSASRFTIATSALATDKPDEYETSSMADKSYFKALGKMQLMDIVMGNVDRGIGLYNPENYKVDGKSHTISMIDNVDAGKLELSGFGDKRDLLTTLKNGSRDELKALLRSEQYFMYADTYNDLIRNEDFMDAYIDGMLKARKKLPKFLKKMESFHDKSSNPEYKTAMSVMLDNARSIIPSVPAKAGKYIFGIG
ncbi:MAG: hypothetical protein EOO61_07710 [Hymenobacter sp.]|nr:MAG: hypothetical protein EOO61_07710 [Hymenobacter sp.]